MDSAATPEPQVQDVSKKPLIRSIRTFGTGDNFGIELNGDRAFLNQDARQPKRREISFEDGENLLSEFYSIKELESFSGAKIQNKRTDTHLWINVYDEKPEKYSQDWVAYAIPRELLTSDAAIIQWLKSLDDMRSNQASEQDADGNRH